MSIILDFDGMRSSKNIFLWVICSRLSGRLIDSAVSIAWKSFVGELILNKDMKDDIKPREIPISRAGER